jgi:hypothetical protein
MLRQAWLAAAMLAACSSSSGGGPQPCNVDPFSCPTGQTCWALDVSTFKCMNSGAGKAGDGCSALFGQPECGDGLACFMSATTSQGVCTPFCEPSHPCANGATCRAAYFAPGGAQIPICASVPSDAGTDASADANANASDSSADAPSDATSQ